MGLIGLVSDTHGLVRPTIFAALDGVDLILHAGDVGESVLTELRAIAPVRAVRGNTDPLDDPELPDAIEMEHEGVRIHVSHGHELGAPTPHALLEAYAADVIVYGHTHKQLLVQADERWVVNPGAAGARRFKLSPSVARMTIEAGRVKIDFVDLD